jgi:hypothetical protein
MTMSKAVEDERGQGGSQVVSKHKYEVAGIFAHQMTSLTAIFFHEFVVLKLFFERFKGP